MLKFVAIFLVAYLALAEAKPLTELKLSNNVRVDTEHVDCKLSAEMIDECGLQQGFSYRFKDYDFPTNRTFLMSSCRRQADALKCLRAYSKCLSPLSRQVLLALVSSRQKYNKKLCSDKPNEFATKFLEYSQCVRSQPGVLDRATKAEINTIVLPEALISHKIENAAERLKQACCSVARGRKESNEAAQPQCNQYAQVPTDYSDSFLADTVGIICPNHEHIRQDCDKLPKIPVAKSPQARNLIRPIMDVVQTLV